MKRQADWCVVFDFDGTCITREVGSLFTVIDQVALTSDKLKEESKQMRKFFLHKAHHGKLSVKEEIHWLDQTIKLYKEGKLTLIKAGSVLREVTLRDGVWKCLERFHNMGVPIAIISYGVRDFIDIVLRANHADAFVDEIYAANLVLDKKTLITGYKKHTAVFPETKGKFSLRFAKKHGVSRTRILAVGDSGSDRYLGYLKKNRLGIVEDYEKIKQVKTFMGEIFLTKSFYPISDRLLEKIERGRQ
ncbi:MAG: HAD-IB family phosphatase [Patescibacteria group bacterium]